MKYLSLDKHYPEIFAIINKNLALPNDPVPNYLTETQGLDQISGILERIKTDYYQTFLDKAAYLYVGIALGHYFSNGNKRLAITSLSYFALINHYVPRSVSLEMHKQELIKLFPDFKLGKVLTNTNISDSMLYHLTLYICFGKRDFKIVMKKVKAYLIYSYQKRP